MGLTRERRRRVLWLDEPEADREVSLRAERGLINSDEADLLRAFARDGHVLLPRAVDEATIDATVADLERAWTSGEPALWVEHYDGGARSVVPMRAALRTRRHKVLDLYAASSAARRAMLSSATVRFLRILFDGPPLAFQSLSFEFGTEQPLHQDAAFVRVLEPLQFVGAWLALEDIPEGSGELLYYSGSHRLAPYWFAGRTRWMAESLSYDEYASCEYLAWLHACAREAGIEPSLHRPRKGDLLLWHPDLYHGGSKVQDPSLTRRSIVTHYCPVSARPYYFLIDVHSGRIADASGGYYAHPRRAQPGSWRGHYYARLRDVKRFYQFYRRLAGAG